MPQIHLRAEPGDYAPIVLLPGDPNRATTMASLFDGGLAAARKVKIGLTARRVPLLAISAAFTFVVMMFNVPLPGATTGHAVGGVLIAIAVGPWGAALAISIALAIQALLFGDNKKFITGLIVPRREAIERYAREKTIVAADYAALLGRNEIRELIASEIERATAELAPFEKVRAFKLLSDGFTVANELLTPTLKLRRQRIVERYRGEIDAMYAAGGER